MKQRMVVKFAASFGAALLLFSAVLGSVFLLLFRQHTIAINRAEMERKAVSIAETLSGFASGQGGHNGMGGYGAYLRFLDRLAMSDVWIVDQDLNLLIYGHSHTTVYADLPENAGRVVDRVFQGEVTYGEEFAGMTETPSLTVGAPIRQDGNQIIGAVLLHSPVSGIDDAVHQGLSALAIAMGAALLLSGGAAALLSYRLSDPIERMRLAALQLAEGHYQVKTGVVQQDELGQLAQTIDLLAGRLAKAERERNALDQMREDFVANVSHELRTPVAVLRGSLELLQDQTVCDPAEVQEYYRQMMNESRHLERLVNDLLDLSRLQDEGFILDFGEVNLCDVARDAARAIRRAAFEKQMEVRCVCPEQECLTWGDYGRLRQLLLILLDNAVKFSNEGQEVLLSITREGDRITVSVTDHGAGISPDELERLFERFYKKTCTQNPYGTGLGLAIARQIADRHGAQLSAESKDGTTQFSAVFLGDDPS